MNKKPPRRVLGKGLSALIPITSAGESGNDQEIVSIDFSSIIPNPFQPRREFSEEEIKNLSESIRTQGLLQPLLVRQKEAATYEIISGERRFRALRTLGREKIPCVVKAKVSDREMLEIALVENIQRENLNEIELADAYQALILKCNYTHEELAKQVGKSRSVITNTLRLHSLPEEIQQMVRENELSMGHARALLSIDDNGKRIDFARKIVRENWSVREIERRVQSVGQRKKKTLKGFEKSNDPHVNDLAGKLQYKLGTMVAIKTQTAGRGKITIEYYSNEDLNRIIDLLL